jgi:hypothetical protein
MVDEVKKSEAAREERIRQQAIEKAKPKTAESEFDKLLKQGQMPQTGQAAKAYAKPFTEEAMHEMAKRQDRERDMKDKDKEERKDKKESRQTSESSGALAVGQRVVGKGGRGDQERGGGRQRGFDDSQGKRGLVKKLTKAGVKSIPIDLQKEFTAKMAHALREAGRPSGTALTQQVLDKIVQYVRIGINRAGNKEIQVDLHQKIFRGLKLRVVARGGKVTVHFRTADTKAREIFEHNSDALRDALSKKGIEVEEITIV